MTSYSMEAPTTHLTGLQFQGFQRLLENRIDYSKNKLQQSQNYIVYGEIRRPYSAQSLPSQAKESSAKKINP